MTEGRSNWQEIKAIFFKGLAALIPTALTIYIVIFLFGFVKESVSKPITVFFWVQTAQRWKSVEDHLVSYYKVDPKYFERDLDGSLKYEKQLQEDIGRKVPWWPGFVFVLILIFAFGIFLASFIGRRIWRLGERVITKLPIIKDIYSSAKQVTEFVFGSGKQSRTYSKVVAVEFPKDGMWSVGFQTGWGLKPLKNGNESYISVFIPCSPTPMSGFTVVVPERKVVRLDISFDEAMQFIISCGMVTPRKLMTEEGKKADRMLESSGGIPLLPKEGQLLQSKDEDNKSES